jgi:hypothetical protein
MFLSGHTNRVSTIHEGEGFSEKEDAAPLPPMLSRKMTKTLSRVSDPGSMKALIGAQGPRSSTEGRSSIDGAEKGMEVGKGGGGDAEEEEDDTEGIDLAWPEEGTLSKVYYVIACPVMFLLAYTIPNCKKQR